MLIKQSKDAFAGLINLTPWSPISHQRSPLFQGMVPWLSWDCVSRVSRRRLFCFWPLPRIKPALDENKMDRALLELQLQPEE
uniref:Uncharacterized protein n=1 Tax=Sphaerodactylus townsendi TaxID=933632 RepID=A0ACB8F204_9SAUR